MEIKKKPLFNELGDIEVSKKKLINGNTTNLNDFNNMDILSTQRSLSLTVSVRI